MMHHNLPHPFFLTAMGAGVRGHRLSLPIGASAAEAYAKADEATKRAKTAEAEQERLRTRLREAGLEE